MALEGLYSYSVLGHLIITLGLQLGIFYKCYILGRKKLLYSRSSPTLKLFIFYLFLMSFTHILLYSFMITTWRPSEIVNSERTLYSVGVVSYILIICNPIFEFCLCLERCLAILFPFHYNLKWKRYLCSFAAILCISFIIAIVVVNEMYLLPNPTVYSCTFFTCVLHRYESDHHVMEFRIGAASIDISIAITLIILMKNKITYINSKGKSKNRVILIIICLTTLLEFTPSLVDFIMNKIHFQAIISFIGPYRTTVSSINLLIIIILYSNMLKKPSSHVNTVQVNGPLKPTTTILRSSDI